jgi:hypothetical protein
VSDDPRAVGNPTKPVENPTLAAEPRTAADFVDALIAERGGRDRFNAIQIRLCATIALALRDPSKIEPSVVRDLVAMLPPLAKPYVPSVQKLEIEFVGEPSVVEKALHERIDELEQQLAKARGGAVVERGVSSQPADEMTHQRPRQGQRGPSYEPTNVVPLRQPEQSPQSYAWSLLAEANTPRSGYAPGISHGSEYLPPDRFDETGKRIS